jgi:hypothetical protein
VRRTLTQPVAVPRLDAADSELSFLSSAAQPASAPDANDRTRKWGFFIGKWGMRPQKWGIIKVGRGQQKVGNQSGESFFLWK